ncbi:MAG: hypothetical protein M3380_08110 [Chloroflexota bacterium]|nr:hypothetical protein [Chloroflexota bacterium]
MAKSKRQRMQPTEEWEQLELLFTSPEQRIYEQIRPVVLFGVSPPERAGNWGSRTHRISAGTALRRARHAESRCHGAGATDHAPPFRFAKRLRS